MPLTPAERSIRATIASETSWSKTVDRSARTAPARDAALRRFERQVDPANELPPAERRQRAEHLRRAHMSKMALASSKKRRMAAERAAASGSGGGA